MINLTPQDWMWATWRPYTPLPRPKPRPFDLDALLNNLLSAQYFWRWYQDRIEDIPLAITAEEAAFYLRLSTIESATPIPQAVQQLQAIDFSQKLEAEEVYSLFRSMFNQGYLSRLLIPAAVLLPLEKLVDLILNSTPHRYYPPADTVTLLGFRPYVLPYLTEDEREIARVCVREQLADPNSIGGNSHPIKIALLMGAALGGFTPQLEAVLSTRQQSWYENYLNLGLIFGLDDPARVVYYTRQSDYHLQLPEHARAWLAHTETNALDWLCKSIRNTHNKQDAHALFEVLALVEDEKVVPTMLDLQNGSAVGMQASVWLNKRPERTARGAALAFIEGSAEAKAYLTALRRKRDTSLLEAARTALDEMGAERFDTEILNAEDDSLLPPLTPTPDWLSEAAVGKGKAPLWVDPLDLPPLVLDGKAFTEEQGKAVLIALSKSTLDAPHPLVNALKEHLAPHILDRFAWGLFELWLKRGGVAKEKWAMLALGLLGGDSSALHLASYIRKWPGESQHQRAVLGLNVLRAIGSDTALMQINNVFKKAEFSGIKRAAQEAMENIAIARSMTRDQLEDRIIPDCGLDERGQRVFDFGERKFTFVLNNELKPFIRDEAGKLKPDLPKPTQKDDGAKAEAATAEWKLLKKQVREVAKGQSARLEHALISRRRWSLEEFERFIIGHPLMIHLARRLIWGGFVSGVSKPIITFRVTDERDYADVNDDSVTLKGVESIGLAHPLYLTEREIAQWSEVLSDYEIIPPFVQLGRRTFALQPDEHDATALKRFNDAEIEPVVLVGTLQKLGWERGEVGDGGVIHYHFKQFGAENITAFIEYPGVPLGYYDGWENQSVEAAYFMQGLVTYPTYNRDRIPLGTIDPIVMSEVLRDLYVLSKRGA